MAITALGLNCTLEATGESSTDKLVDEIMTALASHGVESAGTVRIAAENVLPGVTSDEGDGDGWPEIRRRILAAEILVFGTPIWMGHPCSNAQRVMERLDAFLGETDDAGRMVSYDRVAIVGVVGNEDGAHHVGAEVYQGLIDVGFTIPAGGMTYWVGEAMHTVDYKDLADGSDKTTSATKTAAANAAHLAQLLHGSPYPKP